MLAAQFEECADRCAGGPAGRGVPDGRGGGGEARGGGRRENSVAAADANDHDARADAEAASEGVADARASLRFTRRRPALQSAAARSRRSSRSAWRRLQGAWRPPSGARNTRSASRTTPSAGARRSHSELKEAAGNSGRATPRRASTSRGTRGAQDGRGASRSPSRRRRFAARLPPPPGGVWPRGVLVRTRRHIASRPRTAAGAAEVPLALSMAPRSRTASPVEPRLARACPFASSREASPGAKRLAP